MKNFDLNNFGKQGTQKITLVGNIVTLSGTYGSVNIDINGHLKVATFDSDLDTTAENFVVANTEYYYQHGYALAASSTGVITVTPVAGWDTVNRIAITVTPYVPEEASPTTTAAATTTGGVELTGTVSATLAVDFLKARIWKVAYNTDLTIANPVNPHDGDKIYIELTGSAIKTITWGDKWDFEGSGLYPKDQLQSFAVEGIYDAVADTINCTIILFAAAASIYRVVPNQTFDGELSFSEGCTHYLPYTVDSNIVCTIADNPIILGGAIIRMIADGSHTPDLSAFKKMSSSSDWDTTLNAIHLVTFGYDGVDYWYAIDVEAVAPTTTAAPTTTL